MERKKKKKSAPSGSIFKCPEGSSRVFMSCNPPLLLSCPGRAPPQHAFNILFICMCVFCVFCSSGDDDGFLRLSPKGKKRVSEEKSNAKFFFSRC
jgi:hypothetical protein